MNSRGSGFYTLPLRLQFYHIDFFHRLDPLRRPDAYLFPQTPGELIFSCRPPSGRESRQLEPDFPQSLGPLTKTTFSCPQQRPKVDEQGGLSLGRNGAKLSIILDA